MGVIDEEKLSENAKLVKEMTGEDAEDLFGGDAENIMAELSEPEDDYMAFQDREINALNNK